jgi:hypothetical protein
MTLQLIHEKNLILFVISVGDAESYILCSTVYPSIEDLQSV